MRFGVSEQRVNARVRRLLDAGLLGRLETWRHERRLVFLSRRGAGRVGMALRRPPQPDMEIERELMLGRLVGLIETRSPFDLRVLTQREARQAERSTERRHSVATGSSRRWPDLIIETGHVRRAVAIESAPVPTKKLAERIQDYVCSDAFDEVVWLVTHEHAEARMTKLIKQASPSWRAKQPEMRVLAYWTVADEMIAEALSDHAVIGAASELSRSLAPPDEDVLVDPQNAGAPSLVAQIEPLSEPSEPAAPDPETRAFRNRFSRLLGPGPGTRFWSE